MIYINPTRVRDKLTQTFRDKSEDLTDELLTKLSSDRKKFIDDHAASTWRADELVEALFEVVGHKCWYAEVSIVGSDQNVDHFRPWGRVREIDTNHRIVRGVASDGYWWLALDWRNFRLACQHANQRRRNRTTSGGKADFFPLSSARTPEGTPLPKIREAALALDPCSKTDVMLLAFDKEGAPIYSTVRNQGNVADRQRVETSIWLYHLNKREIVVKRGKAMSKVIDLLKEADYEYKDWNRESRLPCLHAKDRFDKKISEIDDLIGERSEFAGAKRCAIRTAMAKYFWIEEFLSL